MEGIVVWIVIIVGWVIIKSIFSSAFGGGGGLSNTDLFPQVVVNHG